MNKILFNEFLKVYDEDYRIQILLIILKDNKLILNSTQILKAILKNYIINDPYDSLRENISVLSFKENTLINSLNSTNSPVLDEILLNIFEGGIFNYFESRPYTFEDIVFDEPFNTFKYFVNHLECIINKGINYEGNSNLSKLYCIAYIKIYLKYFVTFIKEKKQNAQITNKIVTFICNYTKDGNINFRKVLKIYIFKLFHSLMESFEDFKNFDYKEIGITFHKEFSLWKENNKSQALNYCFLTLDNDLDKNNFNELLKIFENYRFNQFSLDENIMVDKINNYGIDIFICIAINKIISNLGNNDKEADEEITHFLNFTKKIFNGKYECSNNLKNLLFLLFDKNNFIQKIKSKLNKNGRFNTKLFEIILYSFRFCIQSLDAVDIQKKKNLPKKKLLFSSILDNLCYNNIKSCYIPGNDAEDLHLTTLEFIENHLNSNPDNIGCYVCSCGYYYSIQPCGFPTRGSTSTCPVCKLQIGYGERIKIVGYHGLVRRAGHMRIFKDENQHRTCMNRYGDSDENVPNKTLANYKKDVIDKIISEGSTGLCPVSKDYFLQRNKKVRRLNELSFRIINFIVYSHLFFANCLNFITDNTLKNYLVKDMKCIEILEKNWEFIQDLLMQKGIQCIQIFMNLIFKRISELIKNCDYFTKGNIRNIFEGQIEELINKCISEYRNYSIKFITENKNLLNLKNDNFKAIINELSPPTEDVYSPNDYPLFKYFVLTKYSRNKNEFIKKLGPANIYALKYPLLHQYLLDNIDTKKMKFLPNFNDFTNYMVDYYSFRISRDQAKKLVLKNEKIFNEPGFQNKFINFINAWKEIKSEAIKYKCRPEMKPKNLEKDEKFIYFLNDDGELGYGMYIASACQNFITWQNTFLQPIIDNVAQNGILHFFVKNMKRKIPVQSAKINQTLLIEDCFENSILYNNFEDIISTFSRRDIFKEDGKINYLNYNSFIYDFASVEEELGKLLLPGKCLFENEDILNFMTFWSEGLRGGKSDTLSNFYLKYPQKDLDDDEKLIIIKYIKKQKKTDFKSFFGSIQLIIFYLTNNIYKNEENIINMLKKAPQYLKISNDCYKFFEKDGKIFKIEKLMNIYFFIEHLCFKDLSETLQQEYKKEIPEDLKIKIKEKLLKHDNNNNEIISTKYLSAAIRRYISRYLAGKRESVDIDEKRDLSFDLTRIDLWEEKIGKLDNLDELVSSKIGEFKLIVGQAYEFYKLIEEEDLNPIDENKNKIKKAYK